jgi:hypothetical protein
LQNKSEGEDTLLPPGLYNKQQEIFIKAALGDLAEFQQPYQSQKQTMLML